MEYDAGFLLRIFTDRLGCHDFLAVAVIQSHQWEEKISRRSLKNVEVLKNMDSDNASGSEHFCAFDTRPLQRPVKMS